MGLLWEPVLPRLARASDLARYLRTCVIMVVFFGVMDVADEVPCIPSVYRTRHVVQIRYRSDALLSALQ